MDTPTLSGRPFLTESPELGPHTDNLLLLFGDAELAAIRRYDDADLIVQAWAIKAGRTTEENAVLDAQFVLTAAHCAFLRARLERLIPDRIDLIRWVFDDNTFEQAVSTAAAT